MVNMYIKRLGFWLQYRVALVRTTPGSYNNTIYRN